MLVSNFISVEIFFSKKLRVVNSKWVPSRKTVKMHQYTHKKVMHLYSYCSLATIIEKRGILSSP